VEEQKARLSMLLSAKDIQLTVLNELLTRQAFKVSLWL
jgi:hypothetical protein